MIEAGHNRRPDVAVFLNGLPVGVVEVKKPGAETATLGAVVNQLQTCKAQVSSLFRDNRVAAAVPYRHVCRGVTKGGTQSMVIQCR